MISRRGFLKGAAAFVASGVGLAGYAFGIEPIWRLNVTRYRPSLPNWTPGLHLRIAVIADIHAGEPYMSLGRIRQIVNRTNALNPDITLLLGDYVKGHHWLTKSIDAREWSAVLAELRAPLGVHSVLGNHDWWDDKTAQRAGKGPIIARTELERVGIPVYENDAVRLVKDGKPFWLAGLGDQLALLGRRGRRYKKIEGVEDLPATLAKVTDNAPIILMAHEPDIFPGVPERVALTLSGHTHGGQVRMFGYSPVVPSQYRNRYAYGHVVETIGNGIAELPRHLIVSGGLGCSIAPVRFGVPPEIVVVELGGEGGAV